MKQTLFITVLLTIFSGSSIFCQTDNTFTDKRDGKIYPVVQIGDQVWMGSNMAYKVENGNCWIYNNDESLLPVHGYLYDWKTALNVCPEGWRLPTKNDFEILVSYVTGDGWDDSDPGEVNFLGFEAIKEHGSSGFNALASGLRTSKGEFMDLGEYGQWFSSEPDEGLSVWGLYIMNSYRNVWVSYLNAEYGFSVRCIRE